MNDKVEGLCAPTAVTVQRKVKGYIFKSLDKKQPYFKGFEMGSSSFREDAYVYIMEEIKVHMRDNPNWAHKNDGKWIVVYEDAPLLLPWQQPPVFIHE